MCVFLLYYLRTIFQIYQRKKKQKYEYKTNISQQYAHMGAYIYKYVFEKINRVIWVNRLTNKTHINIHTYYMGKFMCTYIKILLRIENCNVICKKKKKLLHKIG